MHFKYVEYNLYYNYTYFFFIRQYVLENKSGKKQLSAKNAHDSARRISAEAIIRSSALLFPLSLSNKRIKKRARKQLCCLRAFFIRQRPCHDP